MELKAYKKILDKELTLYLKKKIASAQKIAKRPRPQQILAYIEDNITAGGKRIRPYLTYVAYKMYGGALDKDIVHFSMAAELIHSFALIHDDIIDKGEMRHGKPCIHVFGSELMSGSNRDHIGVSQAILAGDLVYTWAFEVMYSKYCFPSANLEIAQKNILTMLEEVTAGQMIDVDIMVGDHVDAEKLEAKNRYKTGSYTFVRPLLTGALLAGADKKRLVKLEKIGELLGKAYQMRDDILDVTITDGDDISHYDNKTKFSDIQEGQQTYITNYIYEHGTYAARLAVSRAIGKPLSHAQIKELRQVFIESGAIEHCTKLLHQYLLEAKRLIGKLVVPEPAYKKYLNDIVELLHTL